MTSDEMKLALDKMNELGAYSVRLLLDNGMTILVHEWKDEDIDKGLLRVIARGRHALVEIKRIISVEMVPP